VAHHRVSELESEWLREDDDSIDEDSSNELDKGGLVCQGRNYFQVSKSIDLDTCQGTPIYQRVTGVEARCDSSRSNCADQFTVSSHTD